MPLLPGTSRLAISGTKYAAPAPGVGLLLRGSTSGRTGILPHATGPTIDYTLPETAPAANGYVLSSTTVGVLSWVAAGITIDTTPITGGGANRILFESLTNEVSSDDTFVYDAATGRMGIGTADPLGKIDIYSGVADTVALSFARVSSPAVKAAWFTVNSDEDLVATTSNSSVVFKTNWNSGSPLQSLKLYNTGLASFGTGTINTSAQVEIKPISSNFLGVKIQGAAAQTAVLAQLLGLSSTSTAREQADWDTAAIDNTDATRKYRAIHRAYDTAAREYARGWGDGSVGRIAVAAPNSAPTDAHLAASQISFYLDESGHNLLVRAKYADGTTLKLATIALA